MKVELIGSYGGDLTHALSAWTSTDRDLSDEKRARIPALLRRLAQDGHLSPFEKSALHFLVTTDVATHIHLLKHRIGVSVNGQSARYREFKVDRFYTPDDWPAIDQARLEEFGRLAFTFYHQTIENLQAAGLSRQRAKESARFFLPYATEITADVQFNFRSFIHFLKLRLADDAQREVRIMAELMLEEVTKLTSFEHSLAAFEKLLAEGR